MFLELYLLLALTFMCSAIDFNCPDAQSFFAHPKSCEKFIECNNGIPTEIDCIAGLYFNPAVGYCDFPANVDCVIEESEEEEELEYNCANGTALFPHPESCEKYIICSFGITIAMQCPSGLLYNPIVEYCDYSENVICAIEESEEDEELGSIIGPVGNCPEINGVFAIYLTDAADCTIFYECNWGTPIRMNCPAGLYFNPTLKVCDYPANAGCTAK